MSDNFNILDIATSGSGQPLWPAVRNITTDGVPNAFATGSALTNTTVADRLYLVPFYLPVSMTLTDLAIYIGVAHSPNAFTKLAIYDIDPDGLPGNVLAISGNINTTSTGLKTGNVPDITLQAGSYYVAMASAGTVAEFRRAETVSGNFAGNVSGLGYGESVLFHDIVGGWSTFPDNPAIDGSDATRAFLVSPVGTVL